MNASKPQYAQLQQGNFINLESIVRKIMLRRLLSRVGGPKVEKNEDEVKAVSVDDDKDNNSDWESKNNDNNNNKNRNESLKLEEESMAKKKAEMNYEDIVDNKKLVIDEVTNKEELANSKENRKSNETTKEWEIEEKDSDVIEDKDKLYQESEDEKEKLDDEKESVNEADSSTESLAESEIEINSRKSETPSDGEGKDSGIEKGESPTLTIKDTTDEEEGMEQDNENESETKVTVPNLNIPDLRTSSFVGTTTLKVLTPVATSKPKRLVKRSKSARRPQKDIDLDSELSCDSSPEKRRNRRKNPTVSYLSYPQRFVRSSLAVEARLSKWHKETSILESSRGDTPTRNGILKQTPQDTMKNSMCQGNAMLKAPRRDVTFPDSRLSCESDASSDEDHVRMSVRKIYSSKSALRKRIENLEGMLLSMATQKRGLEGLIDVMELWSLELSHVERTKLGVPYIRSVKSVLKKQRQMLSGKKSEFNKLVSLLEEANVPCFSEVSKLIKQLQKDIASIVQDRKRYSSRHIEDLRETQGQIIGTCNAITAVFYDE